eukprot:5264368-Amphidinium_carterae.1
MGLFCCSGSLCARPRRDELQWCLDFFGRNQSRWAVTFLCYLVVLLARFPYLEGGGAPLQRAATYAFLLTVTVWVQSQLG